MSNSSTRPRATITSADGPNCSENWKNISTEEPHMQPHKVVSREQWIEARKAHLAHEKEFTHARERLNQERRALPWVKVDKDYVFEGPSGRTTLADLFKGRSQLVVQHFMFAPDWSEGCKSCSFWADGFERVIPHLAARDTTLVAVSRARRSKLEAFKQRMGWTFDWLSSADSDFNYDFAVSFTPQEIKSGAKVYNFGTLGFGIEEAPGISVFYRDEVGNIFHTYSCFARPRHDECRLSLSRPDAARPSRRWPALPDGLAAAAGRIQACVWRCYMLPELNVSIRHCERKRSDSKARRNWIRRVAPCNDEKLRRKYRCLMSMDLSWRCPRKTLRLTAAWRRRPARSGASMARWITGNGWPRTSRSASAPRFRAASSSSRARRWCSPGSPTNRGRSATASTPR